jgi:uncharacterized protein (TIGR03083 family)
MYAEIRRRMLELPVDSERPVPALPGWSVHATYSHVTGGCADVVNGRMEGAGSPEWTAVQVAERAGRSTDEVRDEWRSLAVPFEAWITERGDGAMFLVYDVWSHYQDVRAANGLLGERDDLVPELLGRALRVFDGRFQAAGVPALLVGGRQLGSGEATAAVNADDYNLLRMLFGRRSRGQIEAMDWEGSPDPFMDHLHLFTLPLGDLND